MGVLCMDECGRIYVASRDSASGKGVESIPETSQDYGVNLYQNPYLDTASKSLVEARMNAETNKIQDAQALSYKQATSAKAKFMSQSQAIADQKTPAQKQDLIAEAIMQGMQGTADFNQLHIEDQQYGARHQAILQGLGYAPRMGDVPYLKSVAPSNALEESQYKMQLQAANSTATAQAAQDAYYADSKDVPLNSIPESEPAPDAQALLIGEGEIYFDTEAEANAYAKMTVAQQGKYVAPTSSYADESGMIPPISLPGAKAALSNKNLMIYGAIAAAYLLLRK
jgi:hypothetical protein